MKIKLDKESDALYFRLDESRIAVLLPATGLRECVALPVLAYSFFERILWYPGGWDGGYAALGEKGL